ncbi:antibiotic biosynthesis monooxygenase family protein [Gynuella sunshinyii]|uniref:Putative enzyme involved in biosynthesis of extracellular polysaccharides n=1 Tax=Gynuella sunshinyii YC6258 TaxID=1445510 RepID=A0A0C5VGH1_9GAMM|nr:antibiotic biosynthesis monooxygenase [Gynuella sunshinyii]AJQ93266.1 putative enzyme involved in biosynthesis of extracellular polysaccharides [Gynuella sunshinyii YC6258]
MFAAIFKAKVGDQDEQYRQTVVRMRELAFERYGCLDFITVTEGDQEIAISYWENEDSIRQWHQDAEHAEAQRQGRNRWYSAYEVEIVEIKRRYRYPADN